MTIELHKSILSYGESTTMSKNPVQHSRFKDIEINHHFNRDI